MDWRLIWYNNSIYGYTKTQHDAEILCEFNPGFHWTIPKKLRPTDYSKHNNKNNKLKLIRVDEIDV
jgi:hypothetical protein